MGIVHFQNGSLDLLEILCYVAKSEPVFLHGRWTSAFNTHFDIELKDAEGLEFVRADKIFSWLLCAIHNEVVLAHKPIVSTEIVKVTGHFVVKTEHRRTCCLQWWGSSAAPALRLLPKHLPYLKLHEKISRWQRQRCLPLHLSLRSFIPNIGDRSLSKVVYLWALGA
jgi:hypothetical protein